MAFGHGKSTEVFANGYDLTAYLSSIETSKTCDTAETTCFGSTAKSYVAGVNDATLSGEGLFDGDSNAVDQVLEAALGLEYTEWCWFPAGDTYGNYGYGMTTINTTYAINATIDDAVKVSVEGQSNVGAERLLSLRALAQTSGSNWTGTANNNGAASTAGGSAYLQVTQCTGTIEVSIRHSTDNFAADDTELVAFTAVTARGSERKTFTGTVKQYVRGYATIAGGESITFQVGIHRA
jgi:hypothetical protein